MNNFFKECKAFVSTMLAYRETLTSDKKPSKYWIDFTENFKYVYELSSDELLRIRYHTYHLTSDSYLTYYFANNGFKKLMVDGYRFFIETGKLHSMDEGIRGIGVETEYGRISHDLLRYLGVICDVKEAGLLKHDNPCSVLEIGGGYGGLARAHIVQNPKISYIICDLEETLFFSAVYLSIQLGVEKVHLIDSKLKNDSLEDGHVYIIPQSRIEILRDLNASYAVSQQSLQEMTKSQVKIYLDWLPKHANYLYSCNINDHGSLANEKQLVSDLQDLLMRRFSQPTWIGRTPAKHNRFGDNYLHRAVYQCRGV